MLTRSTVSGNSTLGESSRGGGIDVLGTLTLTQSTVSGNSTQGATADAAGIRATGTVTISQSTITDNHAMAANASGGGLWNNNDPIDISNSIIAGNTATGGSADLRPGGNTLTVNHTLIGDASDMAQQTLDDINAGMGNLLDVDPLLGALADNGGPTATHTLQAGSPAIDAGGTTVLLFDQRGDPFDRVNGGVVDMGAVESDSIDPALLIVTTIADELDFTNADVSLREAIQSANDNPGADTITFSALFDAQQTIDIDSQLPTIVDTLTISGPGQALLTIDAGDGTDDTFATGDGYRIFHMDDSDSENQLEVTLSGLTLTGGDTAKGLDGTGEVSGENGVDGGAILSEENLALSSVTVNANATGAGGNGGASGNGGDGGHGGGLSVAGYLSLTSSTVSNNQTGVGGDGTLGGTGGAGGGIRALGEVTISGSTISGNLTGSGGADGSSTTKGGNGGGLLAVGIAAITDSTVSENTTGAGGDGGGAYLVGDGTITRTTISGNTATQNTFLATAGGGLFAKGTATVQESTVTGNAARNGGGIASSSPFDINNSIVAGNTATDETNDLWASTEVAMQVNYTVIGNTLNLSTTNLAELSAGTGNLLDVDPLLDVLADNGGPTKTHALLAGSPAINAGDPAIEPDDDLFDQRGTPFQRVLDGRIDIGAFESEAIVVVNSADFDGDFDIDGADFLNWQRGFGKIDAVLQDGDADNDADVDSDDLGVWLLQFGQTQTTTLAAASAATDSTTTASATTASATTTGATLASDGLAAEIADYALLGLQWPGVAEAGQDELVGTEQQRSFEGESVPPVALSSSQHPRSEEISGVDQFFDSTGASSADDEILDADWIIFE